VKPIAMLFLALAACGCATNVNQTSVGGSAREKCREAGLNDSEIDTLFYLLESARAEGASEGDAIEAAVVSCDPGNVGDPSGCFVCFSGIVDEVYSE